MQPTLDEHLKTLSKVFVAYEGELSNRDDSMPLRTALAVSFLVEIHLVSSHGKVYYRHSSWRISDFWPLSKIAYDHSSIERHDCYLRSHSVPNMTRPRRGYGFSAYGLLLGPH